MRLQIALRRLLNVQEHPVGRRCALLKRVQIVQDVLRIGALLVGVHRDLQIVGFPRAEPPMDLLCHAHHLDSTLDVPGQVGSQELDLEARQAIALHPVVERHGDTVLGIAGLDLAAAELVQPADEVEYWHFRPVARLQEVSRIATGKRRP